MISLKQLITVAPFSETIRQELLNSLTTLSEDKKFELAEMCWAFISQDYQNKLQLALQKAMFETAKGEKKYTQEDYKKIEDELFNELATKLQAAGSQEQIEEIRDKLASVQPPQQPQTTQAPQENQGS